MKGMEFYSAAAQIIPLLLILLAFQAQAFARDRFRKWAYWIVVLAFMGETCALIALYTEDPPGSFALLVSLVLVLLGGMVCLAIVLAPGDRLLSMRPSAKDDSSGE